jgi:hypothetical protein
MGCMKIKFEIGVPFLCLMCGEGMKEDSRASLAPFTPIVRFSEVCSLLGPLRAILSVVSGSRVRVVHRHPVQPRRN